MSVHRLNAKRSVPDSKIGTTRLPWGQGRSTLTGMNSEGTRWADVGGPTRTEGIRTE